MEAQLDLKYFNDNCPYQTEDPSYHDKFIALKDIPHSKVEFIRDRFCQNLIKLMGELTVKLEVTCKDYISYGTGRIIGLKNEVGASFLHIATAAHVVKEAMEIKLILNLEHLQNCKILNNKWTMLLTDTEGDLSIMKYFIDYNQECLPGNPGDFTMNQHLATRAHSLSLRQPVCLAMSHPHGCYKYLSHGNVIFQMEDRLIYDTPLCGGSSGGFITFLGESLEYGGEWGVHSKSHSEDLLMKCSSAPIPEEFFMTESFS